jgi:hypothetical protein
MKELVLEVNDKKLSFKNVPLLYKTEEETNLFAKKNNKTVRETISHRRYQLLKDHCEQLYSSYLDVPLGEFLNMLKQKQDLFYQSFLNPYGDLTYSQFSIQDSEIVHACGIYAYTVDDELVYIGRCLDAFKKRVNSGYGRIAPKNCYKDGQSTNCHLNALITEAKHTQKIGFYTLLLENIDEIKELEVQLIGEYSPCWNKQLKV